MQLHEVESDNVSACSYMLVLAHVCVLVRAFMRLSSSFHVLQDYLSLLPGKLSYRQGLKLFYDKKIIFYSKKFLTMEHITFYCFPLQLISIYSLTTNNLNLSLYPFNPSPFSKYFLFRVTVIGPKSFQRHYTLKKGQRFLSLFMDSTYNN